jgi:hypothetical protein
LQSIATGSIVMTLLIGFTLKINAQNQVEAGTAGDYDESFMDFILIGLFALVGVSGLYIQAKTLPCFARCCARKTKGVGNETKVNKVHDASFGHATTTTRPTRQARQARPSTTKTTTVKTIDHGPCSKDCGAQQCGTNSKEPQRTFVGAH